MNRILLLSAIAFLTLNSCSKNHWEEQLINKIEGQWTYEKAKYQAKTFSREDRLEDYKNNIVHFYKDGTVEIINNIDNLYLKGIYSIERTTNLNNNWDADAAPLPNVVYQVQISLNDTSTNELYQELWDQFSISRNVIRFELEENSRPFYFKLCRKEN